MSPYLETSPYLERSPYLKIIIGPMFSGKTTRLIEEYNNSVNKNKVIINHSSDKRYSSNDCVSTHDKVQLPSVSLNDLKQLYLDNNLLKYDEYYIDESQFFPDLYLTVSELMKRKKKIIICGLDGDYEAKPFFNVNIINLIPLCNSIEKLNAKCYICNKDASYTTRLTNNDNQIFVGTHVDYQPTCYLHHNVLSS